MEPIAIWDSGGRGRIPVKEDEVKISNAFPSDYLRAADLQDRNVRVVMDRVEMAEIGDERKPCLYFQGKEKGLILNKTNSNNIAAKYGDDTEDWSGRELILFPAMVDFKGQTVPAIRVRAPTAKDGNGRAAPKPAPVQVAHHDEPPPISDEEVPF
jgi:hypothetical protein